jgi:hypothetical protein
MRFVDGEDAGEKFVDFKPGVVGEDAFEGFVFSAG